jgi:hypothetical protein
MSSYRSSGHWVNTLSQVGFTKTVYHGAKPHAWQLAYHDHVPCSLDLLNPKYFLLFSDDDENGKIL